MPPPVQASFRPALESDVPFLLELWHDAMSIHFATSGISPADENSLQRLSMRFECAEIVCLETKPVGLFKVARDGAEWKLVQIVLAPEIQGQGLAACRTNAARMG